LKLISRYEEKQNTLSNDIKQQRQSVDDLDVKVTTECTELTSSIDDLKNGVNGLHSNIDKLVTTVNAYDRIIVDLKTMTNTLDTKSNTLDTNQKVHAGRLNELDRRVTDVGKLDQSVTDVRQDLRDLESSLSSFQNALNMDQIKEFLAKYPNWILALIQFEKVLRDLNSNIKGGGIDFDIDLDLEDMRKKLSKGPR
jgi:chromosome segregation ATPase